MKYRNRFDYKGQCSDSGHTAESLFTSIAEKRGWSVTAADRKQQLAHIDVFLTHKHRDPLSVDVKAQKKVKRTDDETNDKYLWVEFKNVAGRVGWLRGQADLIAFEQAQDFLLFRRQALLEFCEGKVDFTKRVSRSRDALYRIYQREGRKDEISLIPLDEVKQAVFHTLWDK